MSTLNTAKRSLFWGQLLLRILSFGVGSSTRLDLELSPQEVWFCGLVWVCSALQRVLLFTEG